MENTVLAKLAVTRGVVLHGHFENIDHPKFFVIIGENEDQFVGFFFINSDIHDSIRQKPAQFGMQMLIKKADYDFLSYSSFIGADKISTISKSKLIASIANKQTTIKGNLTDNDLDNLLNVARESKLFSKIEKDTFLK